MKPSATSNAFNTVFEFFKQISMLPDWAKARLLTKCVPYIKAVLTARDLPCIEEFKTFVLNISSWLPRPDTVPLDEEWKAQLLLVEIEAWKKLGLGSAISKNLQQSFLAVLEKIGKETVELLRAYGLELCIFPSLSLSEKEYFEGFIDADHCYWDCIKAEKLHQFEYPSPDSDFLKDGKIMGFRLWEGVYIVDTHTSKNLNPNEDPLMEAIILKLQKEGALSTRGYGGARFGLSNNDCIEIARVYRDVLVHLGCPVKEVSLESVPNRVAIDSREWRRNKPDQNPVIMKEFLSIIEDRPHSDIKFEPIKTVLTSNGLQIYSSDREPWARFTAAINTKSLS